MNNLLKLILFNIILILISIYFRKNICVIYPFIFIILVVMYIKLVYMKNNNTIEGYDADVDSFWNEMDTETETDINVSLFGKINDVIKLLIDLEETDEDKKYGDQKCKGKFKITKSQRECGYNVYDEYQYVITEQGIGCEYPPGHKQRKYKDLCNLNEECVLDQDCERGKCVNEQCKMEFECSTNMLDNCDETGCDRLYDLYEGKYKYNKDTNKCELNSCNKEQYYDCDNKKECESLGYNYKWKSEYKDNDMDTDIYGNTFGERCVLLDDEVSTCSDVKCPENKNNELSKDYRCKRKLTKKEMEGEFKNNYSVSTNEKGEGFLDECIEEVCCVDNYKCDDYFSGSFTDECNDCKSSEFCNGCNKSDKDDDAKIGVIYKNYYGENKQETKYYYNYKEDIPIGKRVTGNYCKGLTCNEEECISQNICNCENGSEVTGNECDENGKNMCASCNKDYNLNETLKTCGRCELNYGNHANCQGPGCKKGCGDKDCLGIKYNAGPSDTDCSKIVDYSVCLHSWFGTNNYGNRCLWIGGKCVNRGGTVGDLHCPLKTLPDARTCANALPDDDDPTTFDCRSWGGTMKYGYKKILCEGGTCTANICCDNQ
jgi:hypothetical protein